ncbi:hypothetical protein ACO0R3_000807 [Hanseniaspora guilliermondii]
MIRNFFLSKNCQKALSKNSVLMYSSINSTKATPDIIIEDAFGNKYIPPDIKTFVTKEYYPDKLPRSLKKEIDEYLINYRMIQNKDWKNLTDLEKQKLYFIEYGDIGARNKDNTFSKESYIYKLIFQILLGFACLITVSQVIVDKRYLKKLQNKID